MKKLRTKSPAALDNPTRWNQRLKPWFGAEKFQERINDRAGLNRDGRPIVRLVWGQSVWQTTFGESTPRYWTRRLKVANGFIWYTVPRWIFEYRVEPEQYVEAWNATRYAIRDPTEGTGQRCEDCGSSSEPELIAGKLYCRECAGSNIAGGVVIDKGPPPTEMYGYMMDASVHEGLLKDGWPHCCTRAYYTNRARCWGEYRPPNDMDLAVLEQSVQAMNAAKHRDPYRSLTKSELAEIELAANIQAERAQLEFEAYEQQLHAEMLKRLPAPGEELMGFSDLGPAFRLGEQRGIILTDS